MTTDPATVRGDRLAAMLRRRFDALSNPSDAALSYLAVCMAYGDSFEEIVANCEQSAGRFTSTHETGDAA